MHIRAKAADALTAEAQIHRLVALQFLALCGSHQRQQQIAGTFSRERRTGGVRKRSRYAHGDWDIGDQQQIGRAKPHCVSEYGVQ
jgi:hypothetical protein